MGSKYQKVSRRNIFRHFANFVENHQTFLKKCPILAILGLNLGCTQILGGSNNSKTLCGSPQNRFLENFREIVGAVWAMPKVPLFGNFLKVSPPVQKNTPGGKRKLYEISFLNSLRELRKKFLIIQYRTVIMRKNRKKLCLVMS